MRAVAFYLPQYHAIPENNQWWGDGFTEWNNVRAARPQFEGHNQPRVPHKNIGYYDLSSLAVIERQHALAMRYGVSGFCYYYYNFSGHNPLELPLRLVNESRNIKNEFCLCWANHDWTRTWLGQSKSILLKQEYSIRHAEAIFLDLARYFSNKRYITIGNKPLLLVYMPEANPMIRDYGDIWRRMAVEQGFEGLFLASVEALVIGQDPATYGFDASIEFAPDWSRTVLDGPQDSRPRKFDYVQTIKNMLRKPVPPYTRLRCVFPGWDNTPRYKKAGIVFSGQSLGAYQYALEYVKEYTKTHLPEHLQFVFINAWNEWGEGCYLEPDEERGFLTLEVTAKVFGA